MPDFINGGSRFLPFPPGHDYNAARDPRMPRAVDAERLPQLVCEIAELRHKNVSMESENLKRRLHIAELVARMKNRRYHIADRIYRASVKVPGLRLGIEAFFFAARMLVGPVSQRAADRTAAAHGVATHRFGQLRDRGPAVGTGAQSAVTPGRLACVEIQLEEIRSLNRRIEFENDNLLARAAELESQLNLVRYRVADVLQRVAVRLPWLHRTVEPGLRALWLVARRAAKLGSYSTKWSSPRPSLRS